MSFTFVNCPNSGPCFGIVPEFKNKHTFIAGGEIRLVVGKHRGPHWGYGVEHIWAEHSRDMLDAGWTSMNDVPGYVASIVQAGTPLHIDSGTNPRIIAVRGMIGMAVLQWWETKHLDYWTVITAYRGENRKHGHRLGTVL